MAHRGLLFRLDDRAMASLRPLRGGCQCGRNTYIIERPADASDLAQVLFNTESIHRTVHRSPVCWFTAIGPS